MNGPAEKNVQAETGEQQVPTVEQDAPTEPVVAELSGERVVSKEALETLEGLAEHVELLRDIKEGTEGVNCTEMVRLGVALAGVTPVAKVLKDELGRIAARKKREQAQALVAEVQQVSTALAVELASRRGRFATKREMSAFADNFATRRTGMALVVLSSEEAAETPPPISYTCLYLEKGKYREFTLAITAEGEMVVWGEDL